MELPNTLVVLRPVQAFVREIFFAHGFGQREVEEVEVALEEALVNGVEHAYGPGGEGPLRVTVAPHPLGLAVVVHDDGLPLDYGALEKNVPDPSVSGLGVGHLLMRRLVDEFRLVNRGRGGKDVEMVKYLPCPQASFGDAPPDEGRDEGSRGPSEAAAPPRDQPMTLRSFRPEDALEVARCAWYAYGYSYAHDHVFFPQRMVELNARGELLSLVATTASGEVAGHTAAIFPHKDSPWAEIGMAFVKPAFSSRGLLKALTAELVRRMGERGLSSVHVQAVTFHEASQKAARARGFSPGALLVGGLTENYHFKTMGGLCEGRLSVLIAHRYLAEYDPFPLFVPGRHRPMVARIYEGMGLVPAFADPAPRPSLPERGDVSFRVVEVDNAASVEVRSVGRDGASELAQITRMLCQRRVDHFRLTLPLGDPGTPELCRALEGQGYFFAGVFFKGPREDALLLQYLNNVDRRYQDIKLFGPEAQELLAHVRRCDPQGGA